MDKDTSGLLIVAKNDNTHRFLSEQLVKREIVREYLALTHGEFSRDRGTINAPIGRDPKDRKRMAVNQKNGKEAITNFKVLKLFKGYSLVQANLKTGRTTRSGSISPILIIPSLETSFMVIGRMTKNMKAISACQEVRFYSS